MNDRVELDRGRDDWREVFERLEAERALQQRGRADALLATLERIARWTGATAG